jgi:Transposase and inactivated derivatives
MSITPGFIRGKATTKNNISPNGARHDADKVMSSFRQILYHIIFRTKNSARTISLHESEELYRYIWGIIKNKNGKLLRINGMEDHVHILSDLPPTIALADYVREIKASSSHWLQGNPNFPAFVGWAEGYAVLTYAWRDRDMIVDYIKNQRNHHKQTDFITEYRQLLEEHGVTIDEKFFP